jgi:cold shock CspA family protein
MFLHVSALEEVGIHPIILRSGQRLIYETGDDDGKTNAADIKLA